MPKGVADDGVAEAGWELLRASNVWYDGAAEAPPMIDGGLTVHSELASSMMASWTLGGIDGIGPWLVGGSLTFAKGAIYFWVNSPV